MTNQIIEFSKVSFKYDEESQNYALKNISLKVNKGEWLAIVGHNGSGKSTLAKLLIGLNFPIEGEITVMQKLLREESIWDIRSEVGLVFQNPDNQFVGTTVQDDVAFGLENAGIPRQEMVGRVQNALQTVKMEQFSEREPHLLSGGQKQRVAIAGVLALEPSVIVLDEATSMLDPKGRQEVLDVVNKLKLEKDVTIISITHNLEEVAQADRVLVLNKGQVYTEGSPDEVFSIGEELVELGLELPFGIKASNQLRKSGLTLENKLSIEELVEQICM